LLEICKLNTLPIWIAYSLDTGLRVKENPQWGNVNDQGIFNTPGR